jgi:uncharacterized protein (TIGR03118 family)
MRSRRSERQGVFPLGRRSHRPVPYRPVLEGLEDRCVPAGFQQTNLVSDLPGVAQITDPKLVNPWGISHSATSPFWVSDNGTAFSTLYQGDSAVRPTFTKNPLEVAIPNSEPTGQVFNGTTDFKVHSGSATAPAVFIFASQTGQIFGWSPLVPPGSRTAQLAVTVPGASYTGLAIGSAGTANYLYAADFGHHKIAVFDGQYHPTTLAGSFDDPDMPHAYAPFNVQNLGGKLYVTYAQIDHKSPSDESDHGSGFVDVFDTSGRLLQRLISGNHLKAPWGIAIAPSNFGAFSNDLIVGNFANGHVGAYDPATGAFLGELQDAAGQPIVIDGLWALIVGNGANGGDKDALYFSAGPDGETHGLFGSLRALPDDALADAMIAGLLAKPPASGPTGITSGPGTADPGTGTILTPPLPGSSPSPQTAPGATGSTATTGGPASNSDALFALDLLFASDVLANGGI